MSEAELSLQVTPATSTSAQAPVGLTRAEAARRLTQFGLNEIRREAATTDARKPRRPWFGPKRFGFGISPQTWQGWVVVAVTAVVGGAMVGGKWAGVGHRRKKSPNRQAAGPPRLG